MIYTKTVKKAVDSASTSISPSKIVYLKTVLVSFFLRFKMLFTNFELIPD